jgi:hypothetical protein
MPSRRDRAHCRHGHELTPENTVERRDRRRNFVYRACRTCEREISLKSWRKRHPPLDRENCRRGHALTPENTVYRRNRRGCLHRRCRTCERENARESYRRCHSHSVSTQL